MNTSKNKFKRGDIVTFNFTEVKIPMRITGFRKERYAKLEHRDIGYDCGEIDIKFIELFQKKIKS